MNINLLLISTFLLQQHHFDISTYDITFLNSAFIKRMAETDCSSYEDYYRLLEYNPSESLRIIHSLQISYSEFFRNPLTFAVLEQIVFPSLLLKLLKSERKEIRIWTAACASGQETYSLVMILEELRKTYHEKFSYRIIATDQSQTRIEDAKRGQFSPETLQNVQMKRLNRWFKKNGDIYTVNNVLKENIDFSVFDLFDNKTISPPTSIFGDFDLIVCANLLFYYKQEFRKKIIQKTENCLSKGGYLVTSETERDILMKNNYQEVFQQSAIFQKYR